MSKSSYVVLKEGEIYGAYCRVGDVIEMTAEQAKHLSLPFGSQIEAVPASRPDHAHDAKVEQPASPHPKRRKKTEADDGE